MKSLIPFILLLGFAIPGKAQTKTDTNQVFTFVEQMPQFPGGEKALEKFRKENLKVPKIPKDERKQGRVVVGFIVEKDGTLSTIKILKPLGGEYDRAVIDYIKSMPPWIPGMQGGYKVKVRQMMPIDF